MAHTAIILGCRVDAATGQTERFVHLFGQQVLSNDASIAKGVLTIPPGVLPTL